MIILGLILFVVCVLVAAFCWLLILSPLAISIVMVVVCNAVSLIRHNKMMHTPWSVMTIMVGVIGTLLLWVDIGNDQLNIGAVPFLILLVYGIASLIVCRISAVKRNLPFQQVEVTLPKKTKKNRPVCRVFAIIFTAMLVIGIVVLITNSAEIGEALPPTILFGNLAIIFWAIIGRK